MTAEFGLARFGSFGAEDVERVCEEAMARCSEAVDAIVAVPDAERTFENTMVALESAADLVGQASGQYGFMAYVAEDEGLRETARGWEQKLEQFGIALAFREDLYEAVRAFAETDEARGLEGQTRRLLERSLRDYRRIGFGLPREEREQVQGLLNRLVELTTEFQKVIDTWEDGIEVAREELTGLPEAFIGSLKRVESGGTTRYRVSLDYPELHPFMSNAERGDLRRELYLKDMVKGGPENVARLEEAIRVRREIATRLGYGSWAEYVMEERMAKAPGRVMEFLLDLEEKVRVKAEADMALLREARRSHDGGEAVDNWDWRFYTQRLLRTEYAIDEFEVAKYFPLEACVEGLFEVTQGLFGLRFEPADGAPRWHPDVQAFDIYNEGGDEAIARFYMDLHPRTNKYGHAAAFTLRRGRRLPGGAYQKPASAIVANFTKPTEGSQSLLRHSEVVTFFHEFGHILHQTLTQAEFLEFAGTATERDFVEAPSQMLEHWCWVPESIQRFAKHYETGEPLPADLLAAMVRAKNVSSGIATLRQLFFSRLDLAYHTEGFSGDSTATLADLYPITGFPYEPGTTFQAGFGHLMGGYDAGYYGYLWSRVFGDDMWTRFEAAGPFDRATGAAYRAAVLARGGSVDGDELVRDFLGREPNAEAFLRDLGLEPGGG